MIDLQKVESLARFLNTISQNDCHFDNCSKKVQAIYKQKSEWILKHLAELEKPTEGVSDDDVIPCVVSNCDYFDTQYLASCCRGKREPVYYLCTDYLKNCKMIKDYAESYHAKKCAECKTIVCPDCKGDGYTSEHDSSANAHDDAGGCLGSCPIQIQCETCNGTGKIFLKEQK